MTDAHPLAAFIKPGEIERAVWSAMIWAADNNPGFDGCPEYTDRGNSFAETEARRAATRILAAIPADAVLALVGAVLEQARRAIRDRRQLLHAQVEALDIEREDEVYAICEKIVKALRHDASAALARIERAAEARGMESVFAAMKYLEHPDGAIDMDRAEAVAELRRILRKIADAKEADHA